MMTTKTKIVHSDRISERRKALFPSDFSDSNFSDIQALDSLEDDPLHSHFPFFKNRFDDYVIVDDDRDNEREKLSELSLRSESTRMSPLYLSPMQALVSSPLLYSPNVGANKSPNAGANKSPNVSVAKSPSFKTPNDGTVKVNSKQQKRKAVEVSSSTSKVRTALFPDDDVVVPTKCFYGSAKVEKSTSKSLAVYMNSRNERRGKSNALRAKKKRSGKINAGIMHKIRKPKQRGGLKNAQYIKTALSIWEKKPLDGYLNEIADITSSKKQIKPLPDLQNTFETKLQGIHALDSTEGAKVQFDNIEGQKTISEEENDTGVKITSNDNQQTTNKFFKSRASRATVKINENVQLNVTNGQVKLTTAIKRKAPLNDATNIAPKRSQLHTIARSANEKVEISLSFDDDAEENVDIERLLAVIDHDWTGDENNYSELNVNFVEENRRGLINTEGFNRENRQMKEFERKKENGDSDQFRKTAIHSEVRKDDADQTIGVSEMYEDVVNMDDFQEALVNYNENSETSPFNFHENNQSLSSCHDNISNYQKSTLNRCNKVEVTLSERKVETSFSCQNIQTSSSCLNIQTSSSHQNIQSSLNHRITKLFPSYQNHKNLNAKTKNIETSLGCPNAETSLSLNVKTTLNCQNVETPMNCENIVNTSNRTAKCKLSSDSNNTENSNGNFSREALKRKHHQEAPRKNQRLRKRTFVENAPKQQERNTFPMYQNRRTSLILQNCRKAADEARRSLPLASEIMSQVRKINYETSISHAPFTVLQDVVINPSPFTQQTLPNTSVAREKDNLILSPTSQMCDMASGLALNSPKRARLNINPMLDKASPKSSSIKASLFGTNIFGADSSNFPVFATDNKQQNENVTASKMNVDPEKKLFPIFTRSHNPAQQNVKAAKTVKVAKWKHLPEDQMLLDAGQKRFGVTQCAECHLMYTMGDPNEELKHFDYHNAANTLRFNGWRNERVVSTINTTTRIIKIVPGDSKAWWKRVKDLVEFIDGELGCCKTEPSTLERSQVYLHIKNRKIIGCLVAEPKTAGHRMLPSDTVDVCSRESYPVKCGVSRMWTSADHRKQGVCSTLMNVLRANFIPGYVLKMEDVALSAPTDGGKEFAKKYFKTGAFYIYID